MSDTCLVCRSKVPTSEQVWKDDNWPYSCPRCGDYQIQSVNAEKIADLGLDLQKTAVLSHWIRTEHESLKNRSRKDPIILTMKLVDEIIKNPRPSIAEQADNLVRWLGDSTKAGGDRIQCSELAIQAIVGAATPDEFLLVFNHLRNQGIIDGERQFNKTGGANAKEVVAALSFPGVQHYLELKRTAVKSRKAFMAMQYNDKELDNVVENVLRHAVRQTGFDLSILRDKPKAGLIDDRLRVEIQTSRFLIADLTHGNAGAYWEAGYAEGLGRPVIYTCKKEVFDDPKSRPHFDTNHHLTVRWDPAKPEDTAKELKATIRATLPAEAKLTDD